MTAAIPSRARCQGVRQILRFNRPFYLHTLAGVTAALLLAPHVPAPARNLLLGATLPALFWMGSSVLVSWYVYDRSPLYRLAWLPGCLPAAPRHWVNIHAGLDETSHLLAALFPLAKGRVLDIHDPVEMTEPSIEEARRTAPSLLPSQPADWRALPLPDGSCDAAFLMFAAHELRHHEARVTLFREVSRSLQPGGELIVVEHLRDCPNFLAYGPGFLHFHSLSAWRRAARAAGLETRSESTLTPFVHVFTWRRPL